VSMLPMRHRVYLHQAQYLVADHNSAVPEAYPLGVRPVVVRARKPLANTCWSTAPRWRVRWLDNNSGILPVKKAHTDTHRATAVAPSEAADPQRQRGDYPLQEHTRRGEITRTRVGRTQ
jgi:hypothetical protein